MTQALWIAVMGSNPSCFSPYNNYTYTSKHPVKNVSWKDSQTFIARQNELAGETFRLPTEESRNMQLLEVKIVKATFTQVAIHLAMWCMAAGTAHTTYVVCRAMATG